MRHVKLLSKLGTTTSNPATAMSLLEKQAFADLLERNLSQIAVFLNIITGLKSAGT